MALENDYIGQDKYAYFDNMMDKIRENPPKILSTRTANYKEPEAYGRVVSSIETPRDQINKSYDEKEAADTADVMSMNSVALNNIMNTANVQLDGSKQIGKQENIGTKGLSRSEIIYDKDHPVYEEINRLKSERDKNLKYLRELKSLPRVERVRRENRFINYYQSKMKELYRKAASSINRNNRDESWSKRFASYDSRAKNLARMEAAGDNIDFGGELERMREKVEEDKISIENRKKIKRKILRGEESVIGRMDENLQQEDMQMLNNIVKSIELEAIDIIKKLPEKQQRIYHRLNRKIDDYYFGDNEPTDFVERKEYERLASLEKLTVAIQLRRVVHGDYETLEDILSSPYGDDKLKKQQIIDMLRSFNEISSDRRAISENQYLESKTTRPGVYPWDKQNGMEWPTDEEWQRLKNVKEAGFRFPVPYMKGRITNVVQGVANTYNMFWDWLIGPNLSETQKSYSAIFGREFLSQICFGFDTVDEEELQSKLLYLPLHDLVRDILLVPEATASKYVKEEDLITFLNDHIGETYRLKSLYTPNPLRWIYYKPESNEYDAERTEFAKNRMWATEKIGMDDFTYYWEKVISTLQPEINDSVMQLEAGFMNEMLQFNYEGSRDDLFFMMLFYDMVSFTYPTVIKRAQGVSTDDPIIPIFAKFFQITDLYDWIEYYIIEHRLNIIKPEQNTALSTLISNLIGTTKELQSAIFDLRKYNDRGSGDVPLRILKSPNTELMRRQLPVTLLKKDGKLIDLIATIINGNWKDDRVWDSNLPRDVLHNALYAMLYRMSEDKNHLNEAIQWIARDRTKNEFLQILRSVMETYHSLDEDRFRQKYSKFLQDDNFESIIIGAFDTEKMIEKYPDDNVISLKGSGRQRKHYKSREQKKYLHKKIGELLFLYIENREKVNTLFDLKKLMIEVFSHKKQDLTVLLSKMNAINTSEIHNIIHKVTTGQKTEEIDEALKQFRYLPQDSRDSTYTQQGTTGMFRNLTPNEKLEEIYSGITRITKPATSFQKDFPGSYKNKFLQGMHWNLNSGRVNKRLKKLLRNALKYSDDKKVPKKVLFELLARLLKQFKTDEPVLLVSALKRLEKVKYSNLIEAINKGIDASPERVAKMIRDIEARSPGFYKDLLYEVTYHTPEDIWIKRMYQYGIIDDSEIIPLESDGVTEVLRKVKAFNSKLAYADNLPKSQHDDAIRNAIEMFYKDFPKLRNRISHRDLQRLSQQKKKFFEILPISREALDRAKRKLSKQVQNWGELKNMQKMKDINKFINSSDKKVIEALNEADRAKMDKYIKMHTRQMLKHILEEHSQVSTTPFQSMAGAPDNTVPYDVARYKKSDSKIPSNKLNAWAKRFDKINKVDEESIVAESDIIMKGYKPEPKKSGAKKPESPEEEAEMFHMDQYADTPPDYDDFGMTDEERAAYYLRHILTLSWNAASAYIITRKYDDSMQFKLYFFNISIAIIHILESLLLMEERKIIDLRDPVCIEAFTLIYPMQKSKDNSHFYESYIDEILYWAIVMLQTPLNPDIQGRQGWYDVKEAIDEKLSHVKNIEIDTYSELAFSPFRENINRFCYSRIDIKQRAKYPIEDFNKWTTYLGFNLKRRMTYTTDIRPPILFDEVEESKHKRYMKNTDPDLHNRLRIHVIKHCLVNRDGYLMLQQSKLITAIELVEDEIENIIANMDPSDRSPLNDILWTIGDKEYDPYFYNLILLRAFANFYGRSQENYEAVGNLGGNYWASKRVNSVWGKFIAHDEIISIRNFILEQLIWPFTLSKSIENADIGLLREMQKIEKRIPKNDKEERDNRIEYNQLHKDLKVSDEDIRFDAENTQIMFNPDSRWEDSEDYTKFLK